MEEKWLAQDAEVVVVVSVVPVAAPTVVDGSEVLALEGVTTLPHWLVLGSMSSSLGLDG